MFCEAKLDPKNTAPVCITSPPFLDWILSPSFVYVNLTRVYSQKVFTSCC